MRLQVKQSGNLTPDLKNRFFYAEEGLLARHQVEGHSRTRGKKTLTLKKMSKFIESKYNQ